MSEKTITPHAPRILVGVDGSASSAAALRWAHQQASLTGQQLHVVTAWAVPQSYGYVWQVSGVGDLAQDATTMLRQSVKDTLGMDAYPTVVQHVVEGHPATVMLGLVAAGDLLVVGSHGHGGFVGSLLGSVSHYLVGHAPCPVVVIRDHPEQPAA